MELGATVFAHDVCEAKQRRRYGGQEALNELKFARKNRAAQVGALVFSRETALPGELDGLRYEGSNDANQ